MHYRGVKANRHRQTISHPHALKPLKIRSYGSFFAKDYCMRKFKRITVDSVGFAIDEKKHFQIAIQDFSRMGVSFTTSEHFVDKSFVSIMYQNEINQIIHMKIYIKNITRITKENFRIGALFVAVESRT